MERRIETARDQTMWNPDSVSDLLITRSLLRSNLVPRASVPLDQRSENESSVSTWCIPYH